VDTNLLLLSDGSPVCSGCSYHCSVCKQPIVDEAIMTGMSFIYIYIYAPTSGQGTTHIMHFALHVDNAQGELKNSYSQKPLKGFIAWNATMKGQPEAEDTMKRKRGLKQSLKKSRDVRRQAR
jgi:hypothetical protein